MIASAVTLLIMFSLGRPPGIKVESMLCFVLQTCTDVFHLEKGPVLSMLINLLFFLRNWSGNSHFSATLTIDLL